MALFKVLYGRWCRTPIGWFESIESSLYNTYLLQVALARVLFIQDTLRIAQGRHQSYTDRRHWFFQFTIGDWVFLGVSPLKRVMLFGRWGNLSPWYVGPFEILRQVGLVAYELALPPAYFAIHPIVHGSVLRWYIPDDSHVLQYELVELDDRLAFVEEPVAILARDTRKLCSMLHRWLRCSGITIWLRSLPRR